MGWGPAYGRVASGNHTLTGPLSGAGDLSAMRTEVVPWCRVLVALATLGGLPVARILVVDDDLDVLRIIQVRLERAGHVVVGVSSPQKALELFLGPELPDVAVLDVAMPEISGIQVLQTLRVGFGMEDLPVIFLSAAVTPEAIEAGKSYGAAYLTKPFVASALLKAIDTALKVKRPQ